MTYFSGIPRVKVTETESRMLGARGWRKNINGVCVRGRWGGGAAVYWVRFLFCKMKRVLETDGGDHCTTIRILNTTE